MIGLGHYLSVAAVLFAIGMAGIFVNRKNVIIILMSIELMLLAVNINLVAFSHHWGNVNGQVFAIFIIAVAAAEAAVGLGIIIARQLCERMGGRCGSERDGDETVWWASWSWPDPMDFRRSVWPAHISSRPLRRATSPRSSRPSPSWP